MTEDAPASEIAALMLEHVPAAVALIDREFRYLACSSRWLTDFGLQGEDIVGRPHFDVFAEVDEKWPLFFRRALAGETLSKDLERIVWPDGSEDWLEWSIVPWRNRSGEIGGLLLFSQCRTKQVENGARAHALSQELNLLIDSAQHHAICMLGPDGHIVIWNAGAERLYGWHENEVLGRPNDILFEMAEREAGLPNRQLAKAREVGSLQCRSWRRRKTGDRFLADVTISRIDGEDGEFLGFGQVVRDVTDEDGHARAVEASEGQLRSILETVPDAMVVIDEHGLIESFSKAAERLFGYDAAEVIGSDVSLLMPSPDRERHDGYISAYRSTGERRMIGSSRRVLGQRKDGTTFPLELSVGEAGNGGRRLFTGFLRDLSAQEQAQSQMQELQSELLHISRVSAVGTMATALAHEINQPLAAITNYVQTSASLLADAEDEGLGLIREALEQAGQEALRAGSVVHRLREFVSRGELERTIESPVELAEQACALGAVGAEPRGIDCTVVVAENAGPVLVDRVQVQQVLLNLIRNALEAVGEGGRIEIAVVSDGAMMRFTVTDDGPGVAPESEAALFEPFASGKPQGMGIGLSICRTIIEAHGGRLWYEPVQQGGAAFHFTVPALAAHEENHD